MMKFKKKKKRDYKNKNFFVFWLGEIIVYFFMLIIVR